MDIRSLTVPQVAEYLQLAEKTVRSKVAKGEIPRIPNIGEIRIPQSYVDHCELGKYESGTFAERKLKESLNQSDQEIQRLKTVISEMIKIGREIVL